MPDIDVAIIGSGVVGAAVAARLSARGLSCWILERAAHAGGDVTERNSGVVHAGLFYPAAALKTRLCVLGNRALYEWAARANVPHARCGKLIVATTQAEEEALAATLEHARGVGVAELSILTAAQVSRLEPGIRGKTALLSGSTGIVDPREFTRSLLAAAQGARAELVLSAEVRAIDRKGDSYTLGTARGTVEATAVVNAAGLYSDEVAAMVGIDRYKIHPWRGDYFRLAPRFKYRRLIYPVKAKNAPGLGVHLTVDLGGACRLGPDVTYSDSKGDYRPAEHKKRLFAEAARRLLGDVSADDLSYDTCGIRPKLRGPSDTEERDFVIAEDLPRFVNLVGIESPGLTSALAIAAEVDRMIG